MAGRAIRVPCSARCRGFPYKPPRGDAACKTGHVLTASETSGLFTRYVTPVHFSNHIELRVCLNSFKLNARQCRPVEEKVHGQGEEQQGRIRKCPKSQKEKLRNEVFADPRIRWDNPGRNMHPREPDLQHKSANQRLWIDSYNIPAWVDGELEKLDAAGAKYPKIDHTDEEKLWKEYFSNPSQCWDDRGTRKIHPREPDFKHNSANDGLWIDSYTKPLLTYAQLEAPPAQLCESGTPAMRTAFEICGDVRTLCKSGKVKAAMQILNQGGISADSKTYVCLLQECIRRRGLAEGKEVHAHIIQSGFKPDIFLHNTLINMHAKCGSLVDARIVFDSMPERGLVTWNIMIAAYVKHGHCREAFVTYKLMMQKGVTPNQVTFICVLKACASLADLEKGKEVHSQIMKSGIVPNIILETTLVNMYAKCRSIDNAKAVFDIMAKRDLVAWSAMIARYAEHGFATEALETYEQMMREGVKPDSVMFVCVCNACASLAVLEKAKEVHDDILKAGIVPDIILENTLMDMYAKCGSMNDAKGVFENMAKQDVVSWNAMIAGYAQNRCGIEALETYEQMMEEGVKPDQVTFVCVCSACASLAVLEKAKDVHADIVKAGIAPTVSLDTTLLDMFAKCGSINDAKEVFDNMAERDVVSWNAMIKGYAQCGYGMEALETYEQMRREGVKPNHVTFVCLCNACTSLAALEMGKEVHADIMRAGIGPDIILDNTLVDMYAKCGSIKEAKGVFENMAERNVVSWSAMIAGYAQQGCGMEALETYEQMVGQGVRPNQVTFISVCNACASLGSLEKCKGVHADIMRAGIGPDIILDNTLVDMYAKCWSITDAKAVFDSMGERDVVSWNAMIAGYVQHGFGREALETFDQMLQGGVKPDQVTFVCICNACSSLAALERGKEVHTEIVKSGIVPNIMLANTLVDMYAKCGSIGDAKGVFDNMAERNVVSWSAMIAGYARHGCRREALQLFEGMQREGLTPNSVTLICVLSACSHGGLVDEGRHYFDCVSRDHGFAATVQHFGCMVDLLGRAGRLHEAEDVINNMPIKPDAVVWKALLGACRIHGNVEVAERAAKSILKGDQQDAATYVLLSNIYATAGRWDDTAKVRKMMKFRDVKKEPGRCCIEVSNGCTPLW